MKQYFVGTQAMLDEAQNDATKLPFDTLFQVVSEMPEPGEAWLRIGDIVVRGCPEEEKDGNLDDKSSVAFILLDGTRWDYERHW